MECQKCGTQHTQDEQFCQVCGETLQANTMAYTPLPMNNFQATTPEVSSLPDDVLMGSESDSELSDEESREMTARFYAIGSAITFGITFIAALILLIIKQPTLAANASDLDILLGIPLISLVFAFVMTLSYCGIVAVTKWYWSIATVILQFVAGVWVAIFGAIWWTIIGALIMLAIFAGLILAWAMFGVLFYIMIAGFTGFCVGIYKLCMSIRTLRARRKGIDEEENKTRARIIFGIVQGVVAVGLFILLFLLFGG